MLAAACVVLGCQATSKAKHGMINHTTTLRGSLQRDCRQVCRRVGSAGSQDCRLTADKYMLLTRQRNRQFPTLPTF